ncbi:Os05g0100008 [Oryza sativa Japonica Group]|uniref:Os05g0100008 protein n=3 Tax=Oryza TaxID=4527 RepID=A3CBL1_ORYSJ|nr:hypothetical protein OsJ_34000 [Oryza sativa Japonica Group]BAS91814.1 Os05g0100008 [Oryza sativa Japonica Group]
MAEKHDVDRQLRYSARRSFTRAGRRTPARDDDGGAPPFPGYMASMASAKAKFWSMSMYAQGALERSNAGAVYAYSEQCFPFADCLLPPIPSMSPIPSIASDIVFARLSRPAVAQRSPRVKGPMTMTRSRSEGRQDATASASRPRCTTCRWSSTPLSGEEK